MPGKLARSGPRPSFGLAAVPVTVGTSRLSCGKAVKREYSRRFGGHLGNPGLKVLSATRIGRIPNFLSVLIENQLWISWCGEPNAASKFIFKLTGYPTCIAEGNKALRTREDFFWT